MTIETLRRPFIIASQKPVEMNSFVEATLVQDMFEPKFSFMGGIKDYPGYEILIPGGDNKRERLIGRAVRKFAFSVAPDGLPYSGVHSLEFNITTGLVSFVPFAILDELPQTRPDDQALRPELRMENLTSREELLAREALADRAMGLV